MMGKAIIEVEFAELIDLVAQRRAGSAIPKDELRISQEAYLHAMEILTQRPPEAAGILLGPCDGRDVTRFVADDTGRAAPASFTFDHVLLTKIIRKAANEGLECKGFIHSHPPGYRRLSEGDLAYLQSVFANSKNDIAEVLMPIVVDGRLLPFVVGRDGRVRTVNLTLI